MHVVCLLELLYSYPLGDILEVLVQSGRRVAKIHPNNSIIDISVPEARKTILTISQDHSNQAE